MLKKLKLNGFMKAYKTFRTNTSKRYPFHHRGLERKVGRYTWSNRQIWPWSTKWSRAKANRGLQREGTDGSKHPLPTIQEKTLHMDITRWSIPKAEWLYFLHLKKEKLYTVSKNKTTWRASWKIYMQVEELQLELDMEQQTGSKSGKEYIKAVYCHHAYLTYMWSASC